MVKRIFFAELHRIIRLKVPTNEDPHLSEHEEIFLALVKTCKAEQDEYGYWNYSDLSSLEFIDLATIRYTVGRVYDRGSWYVIDRSSETQR